MTNVVVYNSINSFSPAVPEGWTALYGQCLVCVHEGFADRERDPGGALEVNAHKCARHGRVAGKEERTTFLDKSGKPAIKDSFMGSNYWIAIKGIR